MNDIEKIYDMMEKNDILFVNKKLRNPGVIAMTVHASAGSIIAVDEKHCKNSAMLKSALYHENGHCATGAFYDEFTPFYPQIRYEYKADKYVAKNWITKEMIKKARKKGHCENVWDLAEYFNVTTEYMKRIFYIHFRRNL